jgi:hypothetical protein
MRRVAGAARGSSSNAAQERRTRGRRQAHTYRSVQMRAELLRDHTSETQASTSEWGLQGDGARETKVEPRMIWQLRCPGCMIYALYVVLLPSIR